METRRAKRSEESVNRIVFHAINVACSPNSFRRNEDDLLLVNAFIATAVSNVRGRMRTAIRVQLGDDCELLYENNKSARDNAILFINLLREKFL